MIIELLYKYLDHDVRQLTTRYAEARTNDPELRDLSQLGDGTSDQQLIRRLIVTGVGKLRAVLRDKLVNSTENADDERAACSEAEVSGFYKIPEAMCGVQNECSGDAPAKDGAGYARPKREHKAERHVKDGRPKRRGAEENVFHEDKSFL